MSGCKTYRIFIWTLLMGVSSFIKGQAVDFPIQSSVISIPNYTIGADDSLEFFVQDGNDIFMLWALPYGEPYVNPTFATDTARVDLSNRIGIRDNDLLQIRLKSKELGCYIKFEPVNSEYFVNGRFQMNDTTVNYYDNGPSVLEALNHNNLDPFSLNMMCEDQAKYGELILNGTFYDDYVVNNDGGTITVYGPDANIPEGSFSFYYSQNPDTFACSYQKDFVVKCPLPAQSNISLGIFSNTLQIENYTVSPDDSLQLYVKDNLGEYRYATSAIASLMLFQIPVDLGTGTRTGIKNNERLRARLIIKALDCYLEFEPVNNEFLINGVFKKNNSILEYYDTLTSMEALNHNLAEPFTLEMTCGAKSVGNITLNAPVYKAHAKAIDFDYDVYTFTSDLILGKYVFYYSQNPDTNSCSYQKEFEVICPSNIPELTISDLEKDKAFILVGSPEFSSFKFEECKDLEIYSKEGIFISKLIDNEWNAKDKYGHYVSMGVYFVFCNGQKVGEISVFN